MEAEAQNNATLADQISQVLTAAGRPLKAAEIVKKLKVDHNVTTNTSAVNKTLYRGAYEKIALDGEAAPRWKVKPVEPRASSPTIANRARTVQIGLSPGISDDAIRTLVDALHRMGEDAIFCDRSTAEGQTAARLAGEKGFTQIHDIAAAQDQVEKQAH